jgi:precorrin-6B methylase 2
MQLNRRVFLTAMSCGIGLRAQQAAPARSPDVPYVPTPQPVVEAMLKLADIKKGDILYDLGSGDGRIVITAAKQYGIKGTGIDINPERIKEATENAQKEGVTDKVKFLNQDLFEADFHDATVVTLYLLPGINLKLRPKLWKELKPGTRIVSHSFDMGDWQAEKKVEVDGRYIYFWKVPAHPPATSAAKR